MNPDASKAGQVIRGKFMVKTIDSITPSDTEESTLLNARRAALGIASPFTREGKPLYRALAISGGGIRSATFALGFLQSLCGRASPGTNVPGEVFRASRLSHFDYLSTVSGGGYLGAFLCSLFQPGRLRGTHSQQACPPTNEERVDLDEIAAAGSAAKEARLIAADDAVRVLGSGPPGRIRLDESYDGENRFRAPLAWLRENGRYLIPTGVGDAFYAGALGLRNWLALHYVIGTVLTALLAIVALVRTSAWRFESVRNWEHESLCAALRAHAGVKIAASQGCIVETAGSFVSNDDTSFIWWSPLFPAALVPFFLLAVPLGIAFWLISERSNGKSRPVNLPVICTAAIAIGLLYLGYSLWPNFVYGFPEVFAADRASRTRFLFVTTLAVLSSLAVGVYLIVSVWKDAAAIQRVKLTRGLAYVLATTISIAFVAAIDTMGQSLYLWAAYANHSGPVLTPAALVAVLVWLAKKLAAKAPDVKSPSWLKKVPLFTLAGLAGMVIFILVGSLWGMFLHWFLWGGEPPTAHSHLFGTDQKWADKGCTDACWTLWLVVGVTTVLAAVTGFFAGFINLSSLQPFYGSRLTRAYLGASNGLRFVAGSAALSAAEPLPSDELAMEDYAKRDGRTVELTTFAPLHIINVTVNKTVDPAEQIVQRDRKGQPMAVLPTGFSIDRTWHAGFPKPSFDSAIRRPMLVGQWIGTSGAAFSTGIGRETSLGMSLLMGAANVRLGTWWESGLGSGSISLGSLPLRALGAVFRTQTYLSYELRARFFGTRRRWQYLSDGGHFENTGLYELLRKDRRVYQIFGCDNGADPQYRFEDLANLIRLARIDLNVDLVVQTEFNGLLAKVFAGPSEFCRLRGTSATAATQTPPLCEPGPAALLLWATYLGDASPSTQIILIKPNVPADAEADIRQYAVEHSSFPQEPTADQFFDEAQWESYRALGFHLGSKLFTSDVLIELDTLARNKLFCDRA